MICMKKPLCEYQIKNRYLPLLILGAYCLGAFFSVPYGQIVSATSSSYSYGFEGTTVPSQVSADFTPSGLHMDSAVKSGVFVTSTSPVYAGSRAFHIGGTAVNAFGWFNLTYGTSTFLTSWLFKTYFTNPGANKVISIGFYNYSLGVSKSINFANNPATEYTKYMVVLNADWVSGKCRYVNSVGAYVDIHDLSLTTWLNLNFTVDSTVGDLTYNYEATHVHGVACNMTAFANNYRIDRIYFYSYFSGSSWDFSVDSITAVLSTSYDPLADFDGGCIDTSDTNFYSRNTQNMNGYTDVVWTDIGFTSGNDLTVDPFAFELWVGSSQYDADPDPSNYYLYINGLYGGSAECLNSYDSLTYVLQWDLSTVANVTDEEIIFEVYHNTAYAEAGYPSWTLATWNYIGEMGPPSPSSILYGLYGIDGSFSGDVPIYNCAPCWKLYYTSFGTPENEENEDFSVGINLVEFLPSNPLWETPFSYVYKTVWFEIFSNRTDGYYYVNISDDDTHLDVGQTQNYPFTIYKYHDMLGWTPYAESNYTVYLVRASNNVVVDHKHFNITKLDTEFAIWTFPNPSNFGGQHGIGAYLSNFTAFADYYVCGYYDFDDVNNFSKALQTILINSVDADGYWATSVWTMASEGREYWRLWGIDANGNAVPLTNPYTHYVNSGSNDCYIRTSLSGGNGVAGKSFNIIWKHNFILSSVAVFVDNVNVRDISDNFGSYFPYTINKPGTYVISLRVFNDGTWEIADETTVTISAEGTGEPTVEEKNTTSYNLMLGMMFIVGIGVAVAVLLGSMYGFFLGAVPVAYIMSQASMGVYQLVPSEVGYGLIVLLIIVAVIIWFLD